jgi:hypothetical protein
MRLQQCSKWLANRNKENRRIAETQNCPDKSRSDNPPRVYAESGRTPMRIIRTHGRDNQECWKQKGKGCRCERAQDHSYQFHWRLFFVDKAILYAVVRQRSMSANALLVNYPVGYVSPISSGCKVSKPEN